MGKITLGVSQIMKNESHILPRWFETISQIADYVTLVDTGSTDNSKELALELGKKHNIQVDVYDREFDNYSNSRNYAMQMAKDKTDYCFWLDIDETIKVDSLFNKQKLDKDLYMFTTHIGTNRYTRNELWRCSVAFEWTGPIHEYIIPSHPETPLKSGLCEGINVIVSFDGDSWKDTTSLHKKYRNHAKVLEDYIDYENRDPRWVFYTAQSYHDSATIENNKRENDERLRRAMKYYSERVDMLNGYPEERFYSQYRIATIMKQLEYPWRDIKEAMLKAYNIDPMRGEPIKFITEHYQEMNEWHLAYIYSKMGVSTFHNMNPYPNKILYIDNNYYGWRALDLHANISYYTGRFPEAKAAFTDLMKILNTTPEIFPQEEADRIKRNQAHFLNLK